MLIGNSYVVDTFLGKNIVLIENEEEFHSTVCNKLNEVVQKRSRSSTTALHRMLSVRIRTLRI